MRIVAVALVFLVLPAVALTWLPAPFLWISVGWTVFLFTRVRPNRHRRRGPVYLAVGAALAAYVVHEIVAGDAR